MTGAQKECAACCEVIDARAIKCHLCGEFVDGVSRPVRGESGRLVAYAEGATCSACGEEISSRATKCRHCKAWREPREPERKGPWALIAGSVGLAACAVLLVVGGKQGLPYIMAGQYDARAYEEQQRDTHGGDREAAILYARAAKQWESVGDYGEQGVSLHAQADCMWRDGTPASTWRDVAEVYGRAAKAHGKAGDAHQRAVSISWQAWALSCDDDLKGETIACYRKVATAFEKLENFAEQASALQSLAGLLAPDPSRDASAEDWARYEAVCEEALQAYRQAGDLEGQARCLQKLGDSAWSQALKSGDRAKAAKLYAASAKIAGQQGSFWDQAWALARQAECFCVHCDCPDCERPWPKGGSCATSAPLFEYAADLYAAGSEPGMAADARVRQAECQVQAAGEMTQEARQAFLDARKLALEAEDEDLVQRATDGLKGQ